jgi:hypothetical protein
MVYALATSKKAKNVIKTSVDLARQEEGDEMFGSSALARTIVRRATAINEFMVKVIPVGMRRWIDSRFNKDEVILENGAAFDMVRAAVNLVLSGLLIIIGTTMKLPLLSTIFTSVSMLPASYMWLLLSAWQKLKICLRAQWPSCNTHKSSSGISFGFSGISVKRCVGEK